MLAVLDPPGDATLFLYPYPTPTIIHSLPPPPHDCLPLQDLSEVIKLRAVSALASIFMGLLCHLFIVQHFMRMQIGCSAGA